MLHGKLLQRGSETVLGMAANERKIFLTNECLTVQLKDIKGTVSFEILSWPWGHQYRKENIAVDKLDRARAEERKPNESGKASKASFQVKVTRFYRPENISVKAYALDIQELPSNMKLKFSTIKDETLLREKKGKGVESETDSVMIVKPDEIPKEMRLATLDIFGGCSGLSYGLEKAGISDTKWAIEYEEPAGQAFKQYHPKTTVFVNNCNVILRSIMEKCGDVDDCVSTVEAAKTTTIGRDSMVDWTVKETYPFPSPILSPWVRWECASILNKTEFSLSVNAPDLR
ncbi:unnamed protein product [Arabidopsis arenosa]|uniref:BAH domain-containing protein n=1 Tax=Arabidopsis arenosa TaxID=38785 RepID=A0A8S2B2Q5_ARAAE|nr:unnamed protein product [Arabidopsis arenosa]